ncbi:MAG: preprotein translocase subunit YajC [Firmicutes bacterium]|nr:preprotein translocase subunit YajC [Bacillota bacterium]
MDSNIIGILYIVGLFALLWFLLIRPQQKKQKQHQEMVGNLKVNDAVVTIGGIYATVVKVKEDSLIVRLADNVRVEILKNAISQVRSSSEKEEDKE